MTYSTCLPLWMRPQPMGHPGTKEDNSALLCFTPKPGQLHFGAEQWQGWADKTSCLSALRRRTVLDLLLCLGGEAPGLCCHPLPTATSGAFAPLPDIMVGPKLFFSSTPEAAALMIQQVAECGWAGTTRVQTMGPYLELRWSCGLGHQYTLTPPPS